MTNKLESALRAAIEGEVRFGDGDRALYATDSSNYRMVPIGVVIPLHIDDVIETVRLAREFDVPILSRGGGTSLAGQCCNHAVVMDFSKHINHVLEVNPAKRLARVQPGTNLDDLRALTERHGLTFGPDPATHNRNTLGGMIGNDSCGTHSVMAEFAGNGARTADNIEALEVLTYDGTRLVVGATSPEEFERICAEGGRKAEIYGALHELAARYGDAIRKGYPDIPRRVSGYNLPDLLPEKGFNVARALTGTESTCVTLLEATVKLIPSPRHRVVLALGFDSSYEAGDAVPFIREFRPIALEGLDDVLLNYMRRKSMFPAEIAMLPQGNGWLLVEFGGDSQEAAVQQARNLMSALKKQKDPPSMKLVEERSEQRRMWAVRENALGATAFPPGEADTWEGWEDSAVPVDKIGPYLRDLRALLDKHGYRCTLYGHFGQGCIHTRIDFDFRTTPGIENYRAFTQEAAELVCHKYGGSLSGEHGDGQSRGDLLPIMFGPEVLQAMREFKAIWDPRGRMNPGKLIDALPRTSHLRLGTHYAPKEVETHFAYPKDGGSFAHATLRCVGVGECRRQHGGVMCPSFQVTREEKHSTRGRAHLLFEMMEGDVVVEGWKSEAVKESLDLCLACKGCKSDCPVNVDMATYKAEFLSHYYRGRARPRSAYSFGLIDAWARLGSLAPGTVNFLTQTPGFRSIAQQVAGMPPQRSIPKFAERTFRSWFSERPRHLPHGQRVILWPDTFNDHFYPDTLAAAVDVLEFAGCEVVVPRSGLCCGRPLYDYGMLDRAKAYLHEILHELQDEIRAGTPMVGLEPSCVAVFRDELINLFPNDMDAVRLSDQTFTLGEFLQRYPVKLPQLKRRALLHGHCHHKSVMKLDSEVALLKQLGLQLEIPDSGCCGMAGSFGYEAEHYAISLKIGERALFPAVRGLPPGAETVAMGTSCRRQIADGTGLRARHLVEVLAEAL